MPFITEIILDVCNINIDELEIKGFIQRSIFKSNKK